MIRPMPMRCVGMGRIVKNNRKYLRFVRQIMQSYSGVYCRRVLGHGASYYGVYRFDIPYIP